VTEHPSLVEIEQYGRAELGADDLLRVDDHLAACAQCRDFADAAADASHRAETAVLAVHADLASARAAAGEPAPVRIADRAAARVLRWTAGAAAAAAAVLAVNLFWGTRSGAPPAVAPAAAPAPAPSAPPQSSAAVVDPLTADERRAVDAAVGSGRIDRPAILDALRPRSGALMGGAAPVVTLKAARPVAVAVDEERPTFAWSNAGARASYRVAVYDDNFNQVAASAWIRNTEWIVERPLPRGRTFTWQVTARVDDTETTAPAPPQPEARFAVTTADAHAQLAAMRQRAGASHVALAVLLANAGVLDEADRELALAAAEAPASETVRRLRESLDTLR